MARTKPLIPLTALHREYLDLLHKTQEPRLRRAEKLCASAIAEQFSETVAGLEHFEARTREGSWLDFYPEKRTPLNKRADRGTTRIAKRLENSGSKLHRTEDAAVSFRYIDRELVPLRRPGATFGKGRLHGKTSRAAPRLDLLLQAKDGTPVIGEVKVAHDKDPFFGLIQALMHTAHLASDHQAERLAAADLSRPFKPQPQPPFDVYLILEDFDLARGKYWPQLYERARTLAEAVIASGRLKKWVGQIACLDATVGQGPSEIRFSCLWRAS